MILSFKLADKQLGAVAGGVGGAIVNAGLSKGLMVRVGFHDVRDTTAHTIRKPVAEGGERDFPVFLITGRRQHQ